MEHFAFPGNIDFAADDQHLFDVLFMKGSCGYSSMKQCLQSVNGEQFLIEMTGQRAQQVEILDFNGNSSGERRLKFIASGEDDDNKKPRAKHRQHRLAQRRQRRQHSDEKCYNYVTNGADEEREHRLPTLQKAMGRSGNAYSLQ